MPNNKKANESAIYHAHTNLLNYCELKHNFYYYKHNRSTILSYYISQKDKCEVRSQVSK